MVGMTKETSTPPETEDTLDPALEEEEALRSLSARQKELAQAQMQRDPDSVFGISMFGLLRDGNEPLEATVNKASRRNLTYDLRAKRAMRLGQLMVEMTPFQERFVHHYVAKKWDSLGEVSLLAGSKAKKPQYLRNIAYLTLKNETVMEAIGLLTVAKLEAEGLDRHEVIAMFRDNHATAISKGDLKEANVAAERLGIVAGLFAPKAGMASTKDLSKTEYMQLKEINQLSQPHLNPSKLGTGPDVDAEERKQALREQLEIAQGRVSKPKAN